MFYILQSYCEKDLNEGKRMVAYNTPAFAQELGIKKFIDKFFPIYEILTNDKLVSVREHIAAGVHEVSCLLITYVRKILNIFGHDRCYEYKLNEIFLGLVNDEFSEVLAVLVSNIDKSIMTLCENPEDPITVYQSSILLESFNKGTTKTIDPS
jgi:hypothetical protein